MTVTNLDMLGAVGHWELVGRADDLSRLSAAAEGPSTRGLVLSGRPGIGKSRLLREGVGRLPADRFTVLVAAADTAGPDLPFGGLAQVLPPGPPAGLSPAGLLRWAVDALHADAGDRPILLAVDDAHLLDPPSAALVHRLVREGTTLLATVRAGEPVPPPIAALWTEGLVRHAELAPLSEAESRDLLAAMLGAPVEVSSAHRLAGLAAGNPLLLRELVTAARRCWTRPGRRSRGGICRRPAGWPRRPRWPVPATTPANCSPPCSCSPASRQRHWASWTRPRALRRPAGSPPGRPWRSGGWAARTRPPNWPRAAPGTPPTGPGCGRSRH